VKNVKQIGLDIRFIADAAHGLGRDLQRADIEKLGLDASKHVIDRIESIQELLNEAKVAVYEHKRSALYDREAGKEQS
jgi:hypothetical protein